MFHVEQIDKFIPGILRYLPVDLLTPLIKNSQRFHVEH